MSCRVERDVFGSGKRRGGAGRRLGKTGGPLGIVSVLDEEKDFGLVQEAFLAGGGVEGDQTHRQDALDSGESFEVRHGEDERDSAAREDREGEGLEGKIFWTGGRGERPGADLVRHEGLEGEALEGS